MHQFEGPDGPGRWAYPVLLLMLCSAYLQGGLVKLFDLRGAAAEMARFGVPFPALSSLAAIATELIGSVLVLSGWFRRATCLWLAVFTLFATVFAAPFWSLPSGAARFAATATFLEHLGLVAAFCLVALIEPRTTR